MIQFIKRFTEWLRLKKQLDTSNSEPPLFNEGEIWWCYVGENIGVEISGKTNLFTRPVLILRKYNRYSFFGLPLTTKERNGTWYIPIMFNGKRQTVILIQGKVYDYHRLQIKIGQIAEIHLTIIRFAYSALHYPSKEKTYIRIQ